MELEELTYYNNHNYARLKLAKALKSETHIKFYKAMHDLQHIYGCMPRELGILREEMETKFMHFLKNHVSNFSEVYRAL